MGTGRVELLRVRVWVGLRYVGYGAGRVDYFDKSVNNYCLNGRKSHKLVHSFNSDFISPCCSLLPVKKKIFKLQVLFKLN